MSAHDQADAVEVARPAAGLRFVWDRATGFVDVSPLPGAEVEVYEALDASDLTDHFSEEALAAIADVWISENADLAG